MPPKRMRSQMLTQVAKVTKRALGGTTAKTTGSTLKKVKKEKHVAANEVVVEGEEKESLSLRLARTLAKADKLPPVCSPGQPDWRVADGLRHLMGGPDGEAWAEAIGRLGIPRKVVARCGKASATGEEAPLGIFRDTLSFESLAKVIIYQQLHGAACEKIFARTRVALGGDLSPRAVLGAVAAWGPVPGSSDRKDKQLVNGKPSGLSRNKWKYLTSLAEHFSDPAKLQGVKLQELDDAELKKKLVAVTGLGTWSVEMFQIFKLSRQDIYSPGDLAIRKGTARLLKRNEDSFAKPKAAREADELAEPWAPYRSLACMYLYSIIDTKGV